MLALRPRLGGDVGPLLLELRPRVRLGGDAGPLLLALRPRPRAEDGDLVLAFLGLFALERLLEDAGCFGAFFLVLAFFA